MTITDTRAAVGAQTRPWPPHQGEWTYDDYARLPNDQWRYEIIRGELRMSPAPRTQHQETSLHLASALHQFAHTNQLGKVFTAPIDVILSDRATDETIASPVQPDILFIAQERLEIVQEKYIVGAPDLIIEILSPSNWLDDRRDKYTVYEAAGVREYWIVDPDNSTLADMEVFVLRDDQYTQVGRYGAGDVVRADVVAGFESAVSTFC